MIENKIIDAMNNIEEDLLIEALSETTETGVAVRTRRRRPAQRKIAVIIAATLILMIMAGFASGILTAPIIIHNSGKVEEQTTRVFYYGEEVDLLAFETQVPILNQRNIKGQVRKDTNELLSEKKENGDLNFHTVIHTDGSTEKKYDDFYLVEGETRFSSQESALEYIGCKYYEKQYFPYEKCIATVTYSAMLQENRAVSGSKLWCIYSVESVDEKIYVKEEIGTSDSKGYFDDGTYALELFTTSGGLNGGKAYKTGLMDGWVYSRVYEEEGKPNVYEIEGLIVKNQLIYTIQISCDWEYQAEAEKIFDDWVSSF